MNSEPQKRSDAIQYGNLNNGNGSITNLEIVYKSLSIISYGVYIATHTLHHHEHYHPVTYQYCSLLTDHALLIRVTVRIDGHQLIG